MSLIPSLSAMPTSPLLAILLVFMPPVFGSDLKVFRRGNIELLDETQFQWPKDYSQDFQDEMRANPQFMDIYDEQLPALPRFELHKNGKNLGWTQLPVVTRNKPYWLTPAPRGGNDETSWTYTTPKMEPVTRERPSKPEEKIVKVQETVAPLTTTTTSAKTTTTTTGRSVVETSSMPMLGENGGGGGGGGEVPTPNKSPQNPLKTTSTTTNELPMPESALERLRKKLLALRVNRPHPAAEIPVKSNSLTILSSQPSNTDSKSLAEQRIQNTGKTTPIMTGTSPGGNAGFAWSQSWRIGPDGRMEVRTWDREHGERTEQRMPAGTTPAPSSLKKPYKPTFFQSGTYRHIGPTFNCRVLDPTIDGKASAANDASCPLNFPGIPSDGSCQCTYEVSARDENGCALGFVYTCARKLQAKVPFGLTGDVPFAAAVGRRQRH